jgi:hypothetical protein
MPDAPPPAPTVLQLDLFRAVEDVHELTSAHVVLLTDADGTTQAVAGDEDELPRPLRAALAGRRLEAAGSVVALLEPVVAEVGPSLLNVSVLAVAGGHVLAIVFDAESDLEVVEAVGREAQGLLDELLGPPPP